MKEEHRLQFEIHAQNLKKSNPRFRQDRKERRIQKGSGAEGMHEAIQDIVKAMGVEKIYLSPVIARRRKKERK
jgi:hypothetical protein